MMITPAQGFSSLNQTVCLVRLQPVCNWLWTRSAGAGCLSSKRTPVLFDLYRSGLCHGHYPCMIFMEAHSLDASMVDVSPFNLIPLNNLIR